MNKKLIIFICLIGIILSAACVSAAEDVDQTIIGDTSNLDANGDVLAISPGENEILGADENGTFTELQDMINRAGNNPINLEKNYKWDKNFTGYGIEINNAITINGNGHSIDALGHIRIFELKAVNDVILNNITFKNGNTDGCGGAINVWNVLSNSKFTNLNFINNTAADNGGAIRFRYASTGNLFENVLFENNTDAKNGGAIYMEGSSSLNTFKNVEFINNVANDNGGAIYFYGESILDAFNNVRFENNRAETADGGAINFYQRVNNTKFNEVTFYKNTDVSSSGGAINFDEDLVNAVFNHTSFIENSAVIGGALGINGLIASNTFENILFIDNTASNNGGAINIGTWQLSTFNGNKFKRVMFINNTASNDGGALFANAQSSSNTFENLIVLNNTGNNVIYMNYPDSTNVIKDSIFMNNDANTITTGSVNIQLTDNWFGNNATNYNENPNVNANLDNWLFLNATANPAALAMDEKSIVTFKFYSYKGPDSISEYDGSLSVPLDLNSTLGSLDKTNASIGEEITYTPSEMGKGSVKGQFENAYYTINIDNEKIPTTIKLTEDSYIVHIDDTKDNLAVLQDNEGKNITGEYTLTYTSSDVSVVKIVDDSFVAVGEGNATITVSFNGTEKYEATQNATFNVSVSKIPTTITITNNTVDLKVLNSTPTGAALNPPEAGNLVYNSNNTNVATVIAGVIFAKGEGQATITVSFAGNNKYVTAENRTITVNVSLNDASVTVDNDTLDLYVDETHKINATKHPADPLLNIAYTTNNNSVATVDENGLVTAVGEGTAIITVTVGDDKIYAKNSTTITVTVSKIPTEINIVNDTFNLKVLNLTPAGATLNPPEAGNLVYNSNNTNVATVKDGIIVGRGEGQTTITVSFAGDNKYTAAENKTITVNVSLNDASVTVDNDTLDLYVDETHKINATKHPTDAPLLNIAYTTNNNSVATVDENGLVTAVGEGTAIITVTVGDDLIYAKNSTTVTVTVSKIPTTITIVNDTFDLKVLNFTPAGATLNPPEAGNLVYNSNNTNVATVKDGIIFAEGKGQATITVSFAGNNKYAAAENKTITVNVELNDASVTVDNDTADLYVDETHKINATKHPADTLLNIAYTSNNNSVATVDENGLVTAVGEGTAIITVTVGDDKIYAKNSTTVTVTVSKIPTEINIANATLNLKVLNQILSGATLNPAEAGALVYTSSNTTVARVSNGVIYGDAKGQATITVSFAGNNKYAATENRTITVNVSLNDASVTVDNDTVNLYVDGKHTINATAVPSFLINNVTYKSSDESVATVDAKGNVIAVAEGNAIITVEVGDDKVYAKNSTTVTVTVSKIPTEIIIQNSTVNLNALQYASTGATLTPADAGTLNFTSSNTDVAKIEDGKIYGVGAGEAIITVSFAGDNKYAAAENKTILVKVSALDAKVNVNKAEYLLDIGDEEDITATTIPQGLDVKFETYEDDIVSVDANGHIKALANGTATIYVSVGDNVIYKYDVVYVNVTVRIPTEIAVENTTIDMEVLDSLPTGASLIPADAGSLIYTSSNSSVAIVDSGKIVAKAEGKATITVSFAGNDKYTAAENRTIEVTVNKKPTEITLENTTLEMNPYDTVSTGASLIPADAGSLSYISSNLSVATISFGKINAVGEGTATITVYFNGNDVYAAAENRTIKVTVTKIPTEIILENTTMEMNPDDIASVGAKLNPEEAGILTYTSSNSSIVKVGLGQIIAVSEGEAIITVSFNGNVRYAAAENRTIKVTVKKIPTEITVVNSTIDLKVLESTPIGATLTPGDAGSLSYISSNSSIADVSLGQIIAVSKGTATITVYFEGNYKYAAAENKTITVNVELNDASVSVDNDTLDLKVDDKYAINATTEPEILKYLTLNYTSSDESVATVDEKGLVTAVGEGTAIITITVGDGIIYAINSTTVTVTVIKVPTETTANTTENLFVGDEAFITYKVTPEDAEGDVRFMSDNPRIVYVDPETGIIDARGQGTATIVVSFFGNDKYAPSNTTVTVTVSKIPTEITVENTTIDMKVSEIIPSGATLTPSDAGSLSYISSNSSVAYVLYGKIIAIAKGTATITVYFEGNHKYAAAENKTIIVNVELNDASVSVDNDTLNLKVDETYAINATTEPDFLKDFVLNYTSSDESVATVDENGTVTAIGEGTAIITLTVGDGTTFAINSTNVTVTVVKVPTEITANTTENLFVDDEANITYNLTPEDAEGDVRFMSNDTNVAYVDAETGIIVAHGEGTATITVSFFGTDKYAPSNTTVTVTVSKIPYEPNITQNETNVTVEIPEEATGNVTLLIGNETIVAPINDGIATFDLSDVDAGDYNATVIYGGDDKYAGFEIEYPIIIEQRYIITAEDVIKYYGGSERFEVILTDNKGNPVAGATVSISINGQNYTRTTDENGRTSMALNLNSGEYTAVVSYQKVSVNATVTVLPSVNGTDVVKIFRNGTQYYATFRDGEGNYLPIGTSVTFNINGVFYNRQVTTNGLARLNINLEPGTYIITAMNPVTGEQSSNVITVLSRIVENRDITKYYRNGTQYTARIIGDDGNPVGPGETVTFNINGVFYQRQTDAYGFVQLNINLQPGDYIITAEYKGCMVSNNIKVLPVLYADDFTKIYGTYDPFIATLIDGQGQPFADQKIEFNINGVFYYRTTDSSGQALLNINLMPGEYIITSSYNGAYIANTVTVIP